MEDFRAKLKRRIVIAGATCMAFVALNLLLYGRMKDIENVKMLYFQAGMGVALLGILLGLVLQAAGALSNPEKLKKRYIAENDERTRLIYQKSGSIGMNIAMFGLLAASIIAGYFSTQIFYALLGACVFVAIIRVVLKMYYHIKL